MALPASIDPLVALGMLAAMLSVSGFLPYFRDIILRRAQPQRATWLIWSVLGSISLAGQIYEGATASLGFAAAQVGGTVAVFLLSVIKGRGQLIRRSDVPILACAALGLILWAFADTAAYALAISISISLLGATVTVLHAYRQPQNETLATWSVFTLASLLAVIAVGAVDPVLLAYPLYLLVLNAAISGAILMGRSQRAAAYAHA